MSTLALADLERYELIHAIAHLDLRNLSEFGELKSVIGKEPKGSKA